MDIKFNKVYLENFLSFHNAWFQLSDCGFVQILGTNKSTTDSSSSNGTGKSSLFEAICWSLTGETIRGIKKVCNLYGTDGAVVEIEFLVDGVQYCVRRTQEHSKFKTSLTIIKDGEDISGKGIRDSEKILEELFPDLTSQTIGSVIILGQGLPERFTNNTPSGRKEVLETLSKSNYMIDDLTDRVSNRKSTLSEKEREIQMQLVSDQSKQTIVQDTVNKLDAELSSLPSMEDLIKNKTILDEEYDSVQNVCLGIESSIKSLQQSKQTAYDSLLSDNAEYQKQVAEVENEFRDRAIEFQGKIASLKADVNATITEIRKIMSIRDVCPTCKQKIVGVIKPDTSLLEDKKNRLQESLKDAEFSFSNLMKEKKIKTDAVSSRFQDRIESLKKQLSTVQCQIDTTAQRLTGLKEQLLNLATRRDATLQSINNLQTKTSMLYNNIDQKKKLLESIQNGIEKHTSDLSDVTNRLSIVGQMQTALKRDFRGLLLQNVIQYLDTTAKEYCRYVIGNGSLDIGLDGNNLMIYLNGKQYESLSGGEKQKTDVIIQMSLRKLLCEQMGFRCNLICFDEIFDNCDKEGCNGLLNLISTELSDVESIFIVTHHTDLNIPADSTINVVKGEDNISYIER